MAGAGSASSSSTAGKSEIIVVITSFWWEEEVLMRKFDFLFPSLFIRVHYYHQGISYSRHLSSDGSPLNTINQINQIKITIVHPSSIVLEEPGTFLHSLSIPQ